LGTLVCKQKFKKYHWFLKIGKKWKNGKNIVVIALTQEFQTTFSKNRTAIAAGGNVPFHQ
jgi:hypothetical protein